MGVEARPRVHTLLFERGTAIGVLQGNVLDVFFVQPVVIECAQQEQIRVCALGGGDLLAFEVLDGFDRRVCRHHKGSPLWALIGVDSLDGVAICTRQHCRQPSCGTEIHSAAVQELQCPVAPCGQHPLDRNVVFLKVLLQPAEPLQDQAWGGVVGVVDAYFFGRVGVGQPGDCERCKQRSLHEACEKIHGVHLRSGC